MAIISFSACLLLFVFIGFLSSRKKQGTLNDYLLAGRNVPVWLVGLSASATAYSGGAFVGASGAVFSSGLSALWIMFGTIIGDIAASFFIHSKVRQKASELDSLSYNALLSSWTGIRFTRFEKVCGGITLLFLSGYAAAQFSAGAKALEATLDVPFTMGAGIGAVMVFIYCYSGGLRASIWTDAAQSIVMLSSLGLFVFAGWSFLEFSGTLLPEANPWLFVLGWIIGGVGTVGQPQIMIRFMASEPIKSFWATRFWYYGWNIVFCTLLLLAGLIAQNVVSEVPDAEMALFLTASEIMPEVFIGILLAGLFAATISTADSQIVCCTAAISEDLFPNYNLTYLQAKLCTAAVTVTALAVAIFGGQSVFDLVFLSWSVFSSTFGSLLIIYCLGGKPSEVQAFIVIITGAIVSISWKAYGLSEVIYEAGPGMVFTLAAYSLSEFHKKISTRLELTSS